MLTKVCSICNESLPVNSFYLNKKNNYRFLYCHNCRAKRYKKEQTLEQFLKQRLIQKKSVAKRKNIPFDITYKDIEWVSHCPALGFELEYRSGEIKKNTACIDRIDSSKGYVKGNVQILSYLANLIKSNATPKEIMKVAVYMKSL